MALAVLGLALVVLVKGVYGSIAGAQDAFYMGIATDLARGKMYDLEEQLLQEGYMDTEQEITGDFGEEGWEAITWKARIEAVELPSYDALMGLSKEQQAQQDAGVPVGPDGEPLEGGESPMDKFQSSALGGMLGLLGGGGGGDTTTASEATTGGFVQAQYQLVQQVLKQAMRKITLTVSYDTGMDKQSFDTVLYVTDPVGMKKAIPFLGGGGGG